MRLSRLVVTVVLAGTLASCTSVGKETTDNRMFGKNAPMQDITGDVLTTGTSWWGSRYIVVKDVRTGLRVYVPSGAAACAPGKPFSGTGHLTRAEDKNYDATFHFHLIDPNKACG